MTSKVQPTADYSTIDVKIIELLTEKNWGRGCVINNVTMSEMAASRLTSLQV